MFCEVGSQEESAFQEQKQKSKLSPIIPPSPFSKFERNKLSARDTASRGTSQILGKNTCSIKDYAEEDAA